METWNGTGTSLAEARDKVIRDVTQAEVKFIRLWFTDVVGRLKSFAITRDELDEGLEILDDVLTIADEYSAE